MKSKKCRVTLVGHVGRVKCTATSSSGKYVASGADDLSVKLWTADDGRCVASFMCKAVPTVLAFTPAQSSGPLKGMFMLHGSLTPPPSCARPHL